MEGLPLTIQRLPQGQVVGLYGTHGSFAMGTPGHNLYRLPEGVAFNFLEGRSLDANQVIQVDANAEGIGGVGEIEGPSVEYHLFRAGTGVDWPEEEFQRAAERICTLERALHVRHWARDRQTDEMVLPYFEEPELFPNPLIGKRLGLDREKFKPVMDQFYQAHGWDVDRAWPTAERLRGLDLEGVYQPMIEGAMPTRT